MWVSDNNEFQTLTLPVIIPERLAFGWWWNMCMLSPDALNQHLSYKVGIDYLGR